MILLFLILFFLVMLGSAASASTRLPPKKEEGQAHVITEIKKECPPHKWHYQEVKDQEGNTLRWRVVCDVCGPMKPLE
jgi:hypothetical protein